MRPFNTSASTSVHGPWQITPTGLACSKKPRTKATASRLPRRLSAPTVPPGIIKASYSSGETSVTAFSTVKVSPISVSLFIAWASPAWMPTTSTVAPSASTASLGWTNSTCSDPIGAMRIATLRPCNSLATNAPSLLYVPIKEPRFPLIRYPHLRPRKTDAPLLHRPELPEMCSRKTATLTVDGLVTGALYPPVRHHDVVVEYRPILDKVLQVLAYAGGVALLGSEMVSSRLKAGS